MHDFHLPPGKFKFLYLSHYYPHKNIEAFLPLAHAIKTQGLPYCLVVTLAPSQNPRAAAFLQAVRDEGLDDVIFNTGPVAMAHVPSLYRQSDALLMPTLLESFSGTYVEAMYQRKVILTSDMDFARDVCGPAAIYFDPLAPTSILATMELAYNDVDERQRLQQLGWDRVHTMPGWDVVFALFDKALAELGRAE
jgi:glycosyltransferase involved in cell wall biosynthesis